MQQARAAILEMKGKVDTLIVVSNDRLLQIVPEGTPLTDAFLVADDILRQVSAMASFELYVCRHMSAASWFRKPNLTPLSTFHFPLTILPIPHHSTPLHSSLSRAL